MPRAQPFCSTIKPSKWLCLWRDCRHHPSSEFRACFKLLTPPSTKNRRPKNNWSLYFHKNFDGTHCRSSPTIHYAILCVCSVPIRCQSGRIDRGGRTFDACTFVSTMPLQFEARTLQLIHGSKQYCPYMRQQQLCEAKASNGKLDACVRSNLLIFPTRMP